MAFKKNVYIILSFLYFLSAYSTYASTTSILTVEKGEDIVLPIYLDEKNNPEEIKYMRIPISYDSDFFTPLGFRNENSMLSNYAFSESTENENKATVKINGKGAYTRFGPLVEFVLTAKDIGAATIYLDQIYCNYHNLSGGFWLDEHFFQKVDIEIVDTSRFYISNIEDFTIDEDQPVLPVSFFVNIPRDDITGFLSITPESSNADLISRMENYRTDNQCTVLIFPAANAFGETDITIRAETLQANDTKTFSIEVRPVNDAPTFSIPSTITLSETSGPQFLKSWAKNISPGALNETDQKLSFVVQVDQPELFYDQPEIDPFTGDLKFFPFDNLNGQAQLSVYLKDNGDTSNDGHNLSIKKNCTLTITPFSPPISYNPVEKLIFISSNQPISVEKVTPYIRVMACDANGNAVIMTSETQFWLQTDSPDTGWFYVMNGERAWEQSNAFLVIPEGEHSAFFKYRNSRPGVFQIKASELPDQSWSDAIMNVRVNSSPSEINGDIDGNGCIDLKDVISEMQFLSR